MENNPLPELDGYATNKISCRTEAFCFEEEVNVKETVNSDYGSHWRCK